MEIGSIFEISIQDLFKEDNSDFSLPFMQNNNYSFFKFFNTGRSAIEYLLRYVIEDKYGMKVLIPSFVCTSIIDAIKRAGFEYDYYSITGDFQIDIESLKKKLDQDVKIVFFIQYFGGYQIKEVYDYLKILQEKDYLIIEDITQALYTKHQYIGIGDYVLGSLRKWHPIPDGAFLCSSKEIPDIHIENGYNEYAFNYFVAQVMKMEYLHNQTLDKSKYLSHNEIALKSLFSDYKIRNITNVSKRYLKSYDITQLTKKRIENYDYLYRKVKNFSFLNLIKERQEGQVPFGFVVLSEERDKLISYLIDNNIYCNIHWKLNEECIESDNVSHKLSNTILTIPCDQRYGRLEMDYIIQVLERFK